MPIANAVIDSIIILMVKRCIAVRGMGRLNSIAVNIRSISPALHDNK
jgi:hypothetical protein